MHKSITKYFDSISQSWKNIEILIDTKLNYDYSNSTWVAIDGEFTGLYPLRDTDTLWTICSEDKSGAIRIEMIYTYDNKADISNLKKLLLSNIEKYFYFGKLDLAYLYNLIGERIQGPIFDIKLSSIVSRTHTSDHSLKTLVKTFINEEEEIIEKNVLSQIDWVTDYRTWNSMAFQYNVNDVVYLKPIADKLKNIISLSKKTEVVNSVNAALPYIAEIYARGFYKNIFKHGYADTDMQE